MRSRPLHAGVPPRAVRAEQTDDAAEPGEAALDRWLRRELGRMYDAVLAEPVPEDLARLLDAPEAAPASQPPSPRPDGTPI